MVLHSNYSPLAPLYPEFIALYATVDNTLEILKMVKLQIKYFLLSLCKHKEIEVIVPLMVQKISDKYTDTYMNIIYIYKNIHAYPYTYAHICI